MSRRLLTLGAANGLLSVLLGAFGAHVLRARLDLYHYEVYQTAVHYQGLHALALLTTGLLALHLDSRWLGRAGWFFSAGLLLFCGSLYLLALFSARPLGLITPLGGLLLLAGWGALLGAVRGGAWRSGGAPRQARDATGE